MLRRGGTTGCYDGVLLWGVATEHWHLGGVAAGRGVALHAGLGTQRLEVDAHDGLDGVDGGHPARKPPEPR